MSQKLNTLAELFPFPDGGLPNEKLHAHQAISILLEVEEFGASRHRCNKSIA